jgi:hypothetical protein
MLASSLRACAGTQRSYPPEGTVGPGAVRRLWRTWLVAATRVSGWTGGRGGAGRLSDRSKGTRPTPGSTRSLVLGRTSSAGPATRSAAAPGPPVATALAPAESTPRHPGATATGIAGADLALGPGAAPVPDARTKPVAMVLNAAAGPDRRAVPGVVPSGAGTGPGARTAPGAAAATRRVAGPGVRVGPGASAGSRRVIGLGVRAVLGAGAGTRRPAAPTVAAELESARTTTSALTNASPASARNPRPSPVAAGPAQTRRRALASWPHRRPRAPPRAARWSVAWLAPTAGCHRPQRAGRWSRNRCPPPG